MSGGEGENIIKSLLIGISRVIGVRHAAKVALVATWRRRRVEPICAANLPCALRAHKWAKLRPP